MSVATPTNLFTPFQVKLNAAGAGSWNAGSPPLGYSWTGLVSMASAIVGQSVTITVSGQTVAFGSQITGSFSAGSGQPVVVSVTGGTPNSTLTGVLQGTVWPGNVAPPPSLAPQGDLTQISGGTIEVSAADVTIVEGQGGQIPVQMNQPPSELGTVTDTTGTGTGAGFDLPAGTHAVSVTVMGAVLGVGQVAPAVVSFYGGNSGDTLFYLATSAVLGAIPFATFFVPVASATDSFITVNVTTSVPGSPASVSFAAVLDTEAAYAINSPQQPIFIQGVQGSPTNPYVIQTIEASPQNIVPISTGALASLAKSTLIAATAGESIRIRKILISVSAATTAALLFGATTEAYFILAANGSTPDMDWKGKSVGLNTALVLQNVGSVSCIYNGYILYDLY
ncbi:MAG: hypothetical protein WA724_09685 [Candidatus Dormiibacterota bacterium]